MMLLTLTLACSGLTSLDATDQLMIDAISGEEEAFVAKGLYDEEAQPDEQTEEVAPLFRPCDPAGLFEDLKADADTDADGELSNPEERSCNAEHKGRERGPLMEMLGMVYDLDQSHELDESERETLFEDFEARCEAIHARVLEDFDADGDGELNEEEKESARAALEEEREARRAEHEAAMEEQGGPPEQGQQGEGPPEGAEGTDGERPSMEERGIPPWAASYDVDGDGQLSDEELSTLRAEARERIRNGEPPFEPPTDEVADE